MAAGQELRDYQIEVFGKIVERRNSILFLPAGSGKTHIAFWLINSLADDLLRPIKEGGKRTFFLVNSTQLVDQQAAFLTKYGNFKVLGLIGEDGVDNYDLTIWRDLQDKWQVFVMTAQIYLDALRHSFLLLENANLIIFDECHRAVGCHPMCEVMKLVRLSSKKPKILGLSATIINGDANTKLKFSKQVEELEAVFNGAIITSRECHEIRKRYSAKPEEEIISFSSSIVLDQDLEQILTNIVNSGVEKLEANELTNNSTPTHLIKMREVQLNRPGLTCYRSLKTTLKDILFHVTKYGPYLGYVCSQDYIIQFARHFSHRIEENFINAMTFTYDFAHAMRNILHIYITEKYGSANLESIETIEDASCDKISYLFRCLSRIRPEDKCIIFVERKMTAKSLHNIIKIFADTLSDRFLSVDFIIGYDSNPLRNSNEGFADRRNSKDVLKNFRSGRTNVIIATDILEEGIDIQECNIVIMFDSIKSYRSYAQSKGRARMQNSNYIVLDDEQRTDSMQKIEEYHYVDKWLDELVDKNDPLDIEDDESREDIPDTYDTAAGASINGLGAVSKIYHYCLLLPSDIYTNLVPYWFFNTETRRCSLQMPPNCAIHERIEGPPQRNRRLSKQSVALKAVKILHQKKQLDDHLMPVRIPKKISDDRFWFPHWDLVDEKVREKEYEQGNIPNDFFLSQMKVPKYLENSRPVRNKECYLHLISTEILYETPRTDDPRTHCHHLMERNDYNFGILTRKALPPICDFLTYSDLGAIKVSIVTNAQIMIFGEEKLKAISKFHKTLFLEVLEVVADFCAYDEGPNGFFIVPLETDEVTGSLLKISWETINNELERELKRPEERLNQKFEDLKLKVVILSHDICKPNATRYLVYNISKRNLDSPMKEVPEKTYRDYFSSKHMLVSTAKDEQMLLRVCHIPSHSFNIRPIAQTEKDTETIEKKLPPEFCHVYSLFSGYWYKSMLLPSILHRLNHILMAKELSRKIYKKKGVGTLNSPEDGSAIAFAESVSHICDGETALLVGEKDVIIPEHRQKDDGDIESRVGNIDRETDVTLKDNKFNKTLPPSLQNAALTGGPSTEIPSESLAQLSVGSTIEFVDSPPLITVKNYSSEDCGPHTHEILEAITLENSGDVFDLKKLKTLGSSYLKYVTSIFTYAEWNQLNAIHLAILRDKLISSENLFYCGKYLGISSFVKAVKFSPKTHWSPPGFSIPRALTEKCFGNMIPVSSILDVKIPYFEQFSGKLSNNTLNWLHGVENLSAENDEYRENRVHFYLGQQRLERKNVGEVLEALLGLYVKTCGINQTFKLVKYFEIVQFGTFAGMLRRISFIEDSYSIEKIQSTLPQYKTIESLCHYEFKNKLYVVQAFTHSSCVRNITDCYQKLKFIGDATLDFLITSYLYEHCVYLSSDQLICLRSLLVNKNTFGTLAVRLQLHKYLLSHNQRLSEAIESFVSKGNFEINWNKLVKLDGGDDREVTEDDYIPEVLGDIFGSLAGAIYLDSGNELSVVWHTFYNFMKSVININLEYLMRKKVDQKV